MFIQYVGQRNTQLIQVHIIYPPLHSKQLTYSTAHVHQPQSIAWIISLTHHYCCFPLYHLDLGVRVGIGGTHYKWWVNENPHKVSLLDYHSASNAQCPANINILSNPKSSIHFYTQFVHCYFHNQFQPILTTLSRGGYLPPHSSNVVAINSNKTNTLDRYHRYWPPFRS